jgi:predicted ArsR family transcriptional regulator
MAEVRLLPDQNWLLIENHCPIAGLAQTCQHYCRCEIQLIRQTLGEQAEVTRTEYLLEGSRRCAYKIVKRLH